MSFAEECWVMSGVRVGLHRWVFLERHVSRGTAGSVEFDWEKAWEDRFLVGWRHTHPGHKFDSPSATDDMTMRTWVVACGRPMVCGVTCGASTRYFLYHRVPGRRGAFAMAELKWRRLGPFITAHMDTREASKEI